MPISADIYSWLNILTEESVQNSMLGDSNLLFLEKQHTISSCMEKGKKAVNSEFEISKQPVSNILKNQENIEPFAHNFQTSNGLQIKGNH